MTRKVYIILGLVHLLLFLAINICQILDIRTFGISQGRVLEKVNNELSCFGTEYQFDAKVLLDIYEDQKIIIETNYLSNKLVQGEKSYFVYWGLKNDISSPLHSLENDSQYYTDVKISLFSFSSWVTWYYIIFESIKWTLLISGLILIFLRKQN